MKATQTIADGTKVIFNFLDIGWEEFYHSGMEFLTEEKAEELQGAECIVNCLATYTKLGERDYEYYDITFADGTLIPACSGYHLTFIDDIDHYSLNKLVNAKIKEGDRL